MYEDENNLSLLVGKTLERIEETGEEMLFVCIDGDAFRAYHMQDCCESVAIHDITGELQSLVGSPIVEATEDATSEEWPEDVPKSEDCDSFTWTTHRFRTAAGGEVVVRWLGASNGYYGEDVHFGRTHKPLTT
jgi:hypothetical protein